MESFKAELETVIGWTGVDLETRDDYTRSQETNFTNLVADLMRTEYGTDFAIINTGSFRLNQLIPAGPIQMKMLLFGIKLKRIMKDIWRSQVEPTVNTMRFFVIF